jgi:Fe-S-cluster containining protein
MAENGLIEPGKLALLAKAAGKEHKAMIKRLTSAGNRKLDDRVHALHKEVFETIDCLACANCCRTLGPRVTDSDVRRISSSLRMKPSEFVGSYLAVDEEGDYIFRVMPCPFLGSDNYCTIYEFRPKACREYPHTDRPRMYQVMSLALKNSAICPAVFRILERLRKGD